MYLRKSVFTLLLILCNVFVVVAQTTAAVSYTHLTLPTKA